MVPFIEQLGMAYEAHPHAVVITSPPASSGGPIILYANKQFEEMTGYPRHEVIGRSPKMLQGKKTSRNALARFSASLSLGGIASTSIVNYRKNGEEYWCDISAWPVTGPDGEVLCYFAFEREFKRMPGRPKKGRALEKWWLN